MLTQAQMLPDGHYGAANSSCAKGAPWEEALWLLVELMQSQMQPDTVTFCAAIPPCELERW